jgi:hypothetical protein
MFWLFGRLRPVIHLSRTKILLGAKIITKKMRQRRFLGTPAVTSVNPHEPDNGGYRLKAS